MDSYYIISVEVVNEGKAPKLYHTTTSFHTTHMLSEEEVKQTAINYLSDIPGEKQVVAIVPITYEDYVKYFTSAYTDFCNSDD